MSSNSTPGGMSGRHLTVVVVGSLLLVMIVSGYCLWLYSRVERSREQAATAWRSVAAELSLRHHAFEKLVARGVDAQLIDIALAEKFRLAIDSFSTTTQVDSQIAAAEQVELQLTAMRSALAGPETRELAKQWDQTVEKPANLTSVMESYAKVVRDQQDLLSSLGGKLLLFFIKLSEPREFQIVSVLPNSRIL